MPVSSPESKKSLHEVWPGREKCKRSQVILLPSFRITGLDSQGVGQGRWDAKRLNHAELNYSCEPGSRSERECVFTYSHPYTVEGEVLCVILINSLLSSCCSQLRSKIDLNHPVTREVRTPLTTSRFLFLLASFAKPPATAPDLCPPFAPQTENT